MEGVIELLSHHLTVQVLTEIGRLHFKSNRLQITLEDKSKPITNYTLI